MADPNYETLYNDLLTTLQSNGLDISQLSKGDESVQYRSAQDLINLLSWLKTQGASATASTRTIARNARFAV